MYDYRRMSEAERLELLQYRSLSGLPLHEPPHIERENQLYLLTAANYLHRSIMSDPGRRTMIQHEVLNGIKGIGDTRIFAWCFLPNHYHVLVEVELSKFREWVKHLNNWTSREWNLEDGTPGRKAWYRFSDRGIRSERHFWATVNYIHVNPVKHGYAQYINDWQWSSVHQYLAKLGYEKMERLLHEYPLAGYGSGWDI